MSADSLRRAAALMRERAEASRQEPWVQNGRNGIHTPIGQCVATTHSHDDETRKAEAQHIASWHPTVALAVADLLEATAREFDALNIGSLDGHPLDGRRTGALTVARAYLGEQA